MTPKRTGHISYVDEKLFEPREDRWAVVLEGYVEVPLTKLYTFFTRSDDGSKLYIDDRLVVDNDGTHGAFWEYGDIILQAGKHKIRIEGFENWGGQMLRAGTLDEEKNRLEFTPDVLSR